MTKRKLRSRSENNRPKNQSYSHAFEPILENVMGAGVLDSFDIDTLCHTSNRVGCVIKEITNTEGYRKMLRDLENDREAQQAERCRPKRQRVPMAPIASRDNTDNEYPPLIIPALFELDGALSIDALSPSSMASEQAQNINKTCLSSTVYSDFDDSDTDVSGLSNGEKTVGLPEDDDSESPKVRVKLFS